MLYNVYANDGLGGVVNYATPIATTSALSMTPPPLAPSSDTTFSVRASDSVTGLEEANTEARVRIILDASGRDVSTRPNAPVALMVRATAGGGCLATWGYNPIGQGGAPTTFLVYLTPGTTANYTTPAASVPVAPGTARYSCQLAGLVDGSTYTVAVRAANAATTEMNTTAIAPVIGDTAPPGPVDALAGVATFADR